MIEHDTIKLLRECDSGVKMGVSSIDDVLDNVKNDTFKNTLIESKNDHEQLESKIKLHLTRFGDEGKEPNPIAKSMSWIKTNAKLAIDGSDSTVADLMTDGCNMGVKSLSRYLNQYQAADEFSKNIAKDLINIENNLATNIRQYL
ncbi:MAG: hypothetical protein IJN17_03100 [Clostridia bacterium]|nr:hypothetical protein [Oscillospiraceae bacterium]MBQ6701921.1 hypothetical protein [Clostridia bacterium]